MRFLFFLALVGAVFAAPKSQVRIVGGSPTTVQQHPYMANMLLRFVGGFFNQYCGGSLITANAVLSAAHCYHWPPFELVWNWRVVLGSSFSSSGGTLFDVSQLNNHPQYSESTMDYDIGIVRLSTPAVFSASIATVSIAGTNYNLAAGTTVTAIGWGATVTEGFSFEQLRSVDINIIDQELCVQRYADLKATPGFEMWNDVTPRMVCTGVLDEGGRDTCQGDSGGPVVHNDVLYGVVSWGYGCGHSHYPGVKVRVSSFTNWIVDNV